MRAKPMTPILRLSNCRLIESTTFDLPLTPCPLPSPPCSAFPAAAPLPPSPCSSAPALPPKPPASLPGMPAPSTSTPPIRQTRPLTHAHHRLAPHSAPIAASSTMAAVPSSTAALARTRTPAAAVASTTNAGALPATANPSEQIVASSTMVAVERSHAAVAPRPIPAAVEIPPTFAPTRYAATAGASRTPIRTWMICSGLSMATAPRSPSVFVESPSPERPEVG